MADLHIYLHVVPDPAVHALSEQVSAVSEQVGAMNAELTVKFNELSDKVSGLTSVEQSVKVTLEGLSAIVADLRSQVGDNAGAIAKIDELSAAIGDVSTKLSADVVANTPAAA